MEAEGWKGVLEEHARRLLAAHFVKISHHGSENGYCEKLWSTFSPRRKTIAALTPYKRFRLPKESAITHIKTHAPKLYLASLIHHVKSRQAKKLQVVAEAYAKHRARERMQAKDGKPGCLRITLHRNGACHIDQNGPVGMIES